MSAKQNQGTVRGPGRWKTVGPLPWGSTSHSDFGFPGGALR